MVKEKIKDWNFKDVQRLSDDFDKKEKSEEKVIDIKLEQKEYDKLTIEFKKCYENILQILKYYMDMSEENYQLVTIWILGTYLHDNFETYPYLYVNAMRGSAKTRLLKLISHLAKDGELLTSVTEAVLFRTKGSLCIDEFERINSKEKSSIRELLNAAYKKGIKIKRLRREKTSTGEVQTIEEFEVYRPIVIANIWGMEEVLGDRCIPIVLERSNNPYHVLKTENFNTNPQISEISKVLNTDWCRKCSVGWLKQYIEGWNTYIEQRYKPTLSTPLTLLNNHTLLTLITIEQEEIYNKIHDSKIDGRNLELLFPLIITARFLNIKIFDIILGIGKDIVKKKKTEEFTESRDVTFIDFISNQNTQEFVSISYLKKGFSEFLGERDESDKWLSHEWIGKALKRLNLIIDKRRIARGVEIILDIVKAKDKIKMFK